MRRRSGSFTVFVIFLIVALLIFILANLGLLNGPVSMFQSLSLPLQRASFGLFRNENTDELARLKNENRELRAKLVKEKSIEEDNKALRDQFATTKPESNNLLPAYIIGRPGLLPAESDGDKIFIDKGSDDDVRVGENVIFKNSLLGKVAKVSPHIAEVHLLSHKDISFTATTLTTSALGVLKGLGEDRMSLNNVLLSDTLQENDTVTTNDADALIIGKITSVNKKASSLFQSAGVDSLIDIDQLKMVFVMTQ